MTTFGDPPARDRSSADTADASAQRARAKSNRQVDEVLATVRDVIRIASVIELEEVRAAAACASIEKKPLDAHPLEPPKTQCSAADHHARNRQLLEAFARFRRHIEMIRRGGG